MKIALIAPTEIPARRANSMQVMKMAQALVVLGHHVRVVAPGKIPEITSTTSLHKDQEIQGIIESSGRENLIWENLSHHYGIKHRFTIEWLPAIPQFRRYDYGLRAIQWAKCWKADVIYTRLPQSAAIGSSLGMKTILEIHDLPQGLLGKWIFLRFCKGKGAKRLVLITQALATDISKISGIECNPPFTVIAPDGVDLERYSSLTDPINARLNLIQSIGAQFIDRLAIERFTVGYTGHLYRGRGSEILLELAARLPNFTFLIVGGDPQHVSALSDIVRKSKISNIILTGFIPNSELPKYQAACDVLIMPYQEKVAASSGGDISRYLSPMKLFEYLACSRAIISSNLPVLQEVLNPENAILLSGEDVDSWVEALLKLQNEPELRKKLATQARMDANKYTWEGRAEKIMEGVEI